MLLNFDTSSVVAEFSHLAVCGWTVASPSLRPRRFPRGRTFQPWTVTPWPIMEDALADCELGSGRCGQ